MTSILVQQTTQIQLFLEKQLFLKYTAHFECFENKYNPHSLRISEITDCEKRGWINVYQATFQNIVPQSTCKSSSFFMPKARVYVKSFIGTNIDQLDYYVVPLLVDEKPNNVVIHIGSNDITKFNYNNVNAEELAHRIINIDLKCRSYGASNIGVSSILKRSSFNINPVIISGK